MTSGGARAKSGPPPDPNALRRDRKDDKEWTDLPKSGRDGPAPEWPLPDNMSGELLTWEREWRRPQAIEWERLGLELEVAMYVRAAVQSWGPKATAADRNVVQRKMTDLGLTVPGLRANRWRIVEHVAPATATATRAKGSGARDRLQVIDGGEAG